MKKFYSLMLVAVAAMAFTACSQDDTQDVVKPEGATKTITVSAETDTRVTLNADHTKMQWVEGDVFSLFTDADANQQLTYTEGATNFELEVAEAAAEVYAYYPYFSTNTDKTSVSLYVTSSQDQAVAGVLQGANDSGSGQYPMVAVATPIENNSVSLTFRPVACAFAFNIYGEVAEGEQIVSVSFTPADGEAVAGAEYVDLTTLAADYEYTAANGYATTATVTLGTPFTPDTTKPADTQAYDKQVYLTVAAKAYAGGTFVVTTTETTYTFTTASTLDCTGKDFIPMNLNLAKGEKPAAVSLADGDYVILTNKSDWYAASSTISSSKLSYTSLDYDGEAATVATNDENLVWALTNKGNNTYSIKAKSTSKYLVGSSSSSTNVSMGATETALTFELNDDGTTYTVYSDKADTRALAFNGSVFGFYATSNMSNDTYSFALQFVPANFVTTPSMSVATDSVEFAASADDTNSVAVTLKYLETSAVTVTCPEWLDYEWEGTTLNLTTLTANEDTENARTGEVVLSADGVDDVKITVSQKKAAGAGIVLGDSWNWTNSSSCSSFATTTNNYNTTLKSSVTLNSLAWTASAGTVSGANDSKGYYFANSGNGVQIGAGKAYFAYTLTTSAYDGYVGEIKITCTGGSEIEVWVGDVSLGSKSMGTDVTFTLDTPVEGDIKITFTPTNAKAYYLKSISIN